MYKRQDEGHLFVCDHCGAAQIVRLPIALSDWLTASRRFMKAHRHCRPQTVQPAAVEVGVSEFVQPAPEAQ